MIGTATAQRQLQLLDTDRRDDGAHEPVDMPMDVLLGKAPRMHRDVQRVAATLQPVDVTGIALQDVALSVLRHPSVASKSFLITIGDRSVGGTTVRDQMVGPWQVPVADCAITTMDYAGFRGEAMTMGERTPLAVIDAPASGRMAVGEAVTNLAAAPVASLDTLKLSANWMPVAAPAKTPRCSIPCGPSAWNCAGARHRHSGRQGFAVDAHEMGKTTGSRKKWSRPCR